MCMAWLLGGSPLADALLLALRLPNLTRRLLGEGTLSMSLTAGFSRHLAFPDVQPDTEYARLSHMAAALGLRLAVVLGCVVLLGEALAQPLMALLTPGQQPEFTAHSAFLLRVCLPYVFFAGISALSMALLHSLRAFLLPSLSPAFFNLTVITFAGLAALGFADPALLLALGVLCGGLVQCLSQGAALHKLGVRLWHPCPRRMEHETARELRRHLRRLPLSIAGAAAPQLSMLGAAVIASWLPTGSIAALYYAERILEFPLGLAGTALGMASLPDLAALAAAQRTPVMEQEAGDALRLSFCISLPAAAGLLATAEPLVQLLFLRGAFDNQTLAVTTLALCAYAPGLPAYAASRPLLALCNACNNTRLAGTSALIAVPCAFFAGLLLLPSGVAGPALGLSLGLWIQAATLWCGLYRNGIRLRVSPAALVRYAAGSALVFAAAYLSLPLLPGPLLSLMLAIASAITVYALFLLIFSKRDFTRFARRI